MKIKRIDVLITLSIYCPLVGGMSAGLWLSGVTWPWIALLAGLTTIWTILIAKESGGLS